MRNLLLFFILSVASDAISQKNQSLMTLVDAEKSFASYAGTAGISGAFMKYLDDSAKVFEQGKILNGKKVWAARKTDGASLLWYPEFAEIAASGDFGYTTGPSQFRIKKDNPEPDHRGFFSSIWKKNASGEWKVILDIGCPVTGAKYDESKVAYGSGREGRLDQVDSVEANIEEMEKEFIAAGDDGYSEFGSVNARYYRPGKDIVQGGAKPVDSLKISYSVAGTGVARSGDLGYAYGYITIGGRTGNYLRVWKKEDGDAWKIMLEVAN